MYLREEEIPYVARGRIKVCVDLILLPGNAMPDGRLYRSVAEAMREALCDALTTWGYPEGTYYIPDTLQDGLTL